MWLLTLWTFDIGLLCSVSSFGIFLLSFFSFVFFFFFFQAEDGIRDWSVTGVQTCALPILKFSEANTLS